MISRINAQKYKKLFLYNVAVCLKMNKIRGAAMNNRGLTKQKLLLMISDDYPLWVTSGFDVGF